VYAVGYRDGNTGFARIPFPANAVVCLSEGGIVNEMGQSAYGATGTKLRPVGKVEIESTGCFEAISEDDRRAGRDGARSRVCL